jgi:hypothetical protein
LIVSDLRFAGLLDGLDDSDWIRDRVWDEGACKADCGASQQCFQGLLPEAVALPIVFEIVVGDEPWVVADHRCDGRSNAPLVEWF